VITELCATSKRGNFHRLTTPAASQPHGLRASNPSSRAEDQRGVLEISSNAGQIYALGIRETMARSPPSEALATQPPKTKVISHLANGTDGRQPSCWSTRIQFRCISPSISGGRRQPFTVTLWTAGAWRRSPMPSLWVARGPSKRTDCGSPPDRLGGGAFIAIDPAARRSSAIRRSSRKRRYRC